MKKSRSFFNKQFDRRVWLTLIVVGSSVVFGAGFTLYAAWPSRVRVGYQPKQPIAFSHQVHAGQMEISCRYCHVGVDSGARATVPNLDTCMNCHSVFKGDPKDAAQLANIKVLTDYYDKGKPVRWNKVYDLADFVYFDHSSHMVKGLDCRSCHGAVETMNVVKKVSPLTMGWCLKCHMGNQPPVIDSANLLEGQTAAQLLEDPIYREILAPINCSTCHR